jgi:uncharacterized membrane protein (DUF485 family)
LKSIDRITEKSKGVERYKRRLGFFLFTVYTLAYFGFVVVSVYNVTLMEKTIVFGLNLAVFYGLGLIIFAIILALIYSFSCNAAEKSGMD